ncbi:MAG: DUF2249 domain-containing protein [Burkholderiales bacterium]
MNELHVSLSTQHGQIERQLDAVAAAGRAGRWPLYRLYLAGLREGLLQHLLFEEEALFPALEKNAAAAVRALREDHAQLRRHLETLGAAAPEQDPAGCIAELGELAALLRAHHAAEMALDPQYALRPGPRLVLNEPPAMDLRGLRPPEPIVRIFQALERSPGVPLRVILPHEPAPLYALLRERGFSCTGAPRADGGFEILIESA